MYTSALLYVYQQDLSIGALFKYGLLQEKGVTGEAARLAEIETPLSWNIPQVIWFIYIKATAVLVELFQYWVVAMLIAASLVVFMPWEKIRQKMGSGGLASNAVATFAGAVIPICSCGVVPVLAGMVSAGIPLGPTMAFLVSAPMLNVPAVFITASVLGWKLALGRIVGTFAIALAVGQTFSLLQRRERVLRRFLKVELVPRLSPELQQFALRVGMSLAGNPARLPTEALAPGQEEKLYTLAEAGILDRDRKGLWYLPQTRKASAGGTAACFVLPTGSGVSSPGQGMRNTATMAWDLFLQLNFYFVLAVLIAGFIKVLVPPSVIANFVGGQGLNSVLIASVIAVLAYVCTYVEIPTALALVQKGMGGGATLAYLLGGPGVSLPSIVMLSGVFTPRVLALYVGFVFAGSAIAGFIFNLF